MLRGKLRWMRHDTREMASEDIVLQVQNVTKSFPGVKALSDINLTLRRGSVHVLCGENGAGKSTFVKILNGVHEPDEGSIFVNGEEVKIHHPLEARRLGIGMIFQELDYVPEFTVEQTLFLGEEPTNRFGGIDWREIRRRTVELLDAEGLPYSPDTKLKDLSISDIQMIEILKAVSADVQVLLLDEPTSAITKTETSRLFEKIEQLKSNGVAFIYISHKMDEIFQIADEITVLRDGKHIGSHPVSELTVDAVISMMVGRPLDNVFPDKPEREVGEPVFEISGLTAGKRFRDVSLSVNKGEIVGLSGLVGAGRTELVRAAFGLDPYDSGVVRIRGEVVPPDDVVGAMNRGMAMLSEDRKRYGLVLARNVMENASILVLKKYFERGWNRKKKEISDVDAMFTRLNVKTPSLLTIAGTLSGGNQQKVVLAKWLLKDQEVIVLDEPTRGIDVGAKFEIYRIIFSLAASGKAVLVISSELPELIGICDRIYVMAKGRLTGELSVDDFDQETIMKFATQGSVHE
jgi:inositol transport system ATP-binding protein